MWNKSLMWNSPKMWNRPEDVEQAQRGGTGPKINHTCFLADLASLGQRSSLRSAPRFAGQLLKKGGTHEMWNKSLMWNSPKMWNWPKDVEQAQRGRTEERSAILVSALKKWVSPEMWNKPLMWNSPQRFCTGPKRRNRPKNQPYFFSRDGAAQ